MIAEIISILQQESYIGAGKCTEIAKGKHELINNYNDFKTKLKWLFKKK
jgi:hypothetical protein